MDTKTLICFDDTETAFAYKSDFELKKADYLFYAMGKPWLVKLGSFVTPLALGWHLPVRGLIRKTIYHQFCGGEDLQATGLTSLKLGRQGVGVILDYGVEAKDGEVEFEKTAEEFVRVIRFASTQKNMAHIAIKVTGFARLGLLQKINSSAPLWEEEIQEFSRVKSRILRVCRTAQECNIGIMFDAEESWIQQPVDELVLEMMMIFNRQKVLIFNTIQLYLKDRLDFLKKSFEICGQNQCWLGVKLVRGAYLEKERKRAA
ncbi:MAG: proline dehydrogenase family protein, partial [Chitinophagaceae bacterium]